MVPDLGRRIHAAQAYGGFKSLPALAKAMNRPGFGEGTLRRLVAGRRQLEEHEAEWISAATGVPASFFSQGFADEEPIDAALPDTAARLDVLTDQLEQVRTAIKESADKMLVVRGEFVGRLYERISQIDHRLADLDRRLEELTEPDLIELTRRTKEAHVGPGDDEVAGSPPADTRTHEPGEAKPATPPTRARGTRRSG